jgi:hypothetical protein
MSDTMTGLKLKAGQRLRTAGTTYEVSAATDDGTLDTVLRCSNCGEEMCYYFDPDAPVVAAEGQEEESYNAFVESCI